MWMAGACCTSAPSSQDYTAHVVLSSTKRKESVLKMEQAESSAGFPFPANRRVRAFPGTVRTRGGRQE